MNPELFFAFLLITMVLIITPGPIVTLVIATGATQGIRPALVTVAGTIVGNGLLVGAIAFGLAWLLKSSAILFEVIRWAGAAYLVWLGVQAWRNAGKVTELPAPPHHVHFWRGFVVALSNPKTLAFFTAFLPQFVDPALPSDYQLAVMCAVSVGMAAATDSGWAIASGLGRAWFLKGNRARMLARISGLTLIGGGVWLSLTRRPA
ncbi:LysE family translocator [Chelatococcus reniformis]|uniref:Transporter n=1 Tax=Chelatococcus reniformis TaxID=1494448 RepID=A0A916XJV3_9HYPH|nr:LysE family translocator [Chelatococcus reniformis]GGC75740.1 transporter [Chelatococcus reniformis]